MNASPPRAAAGPPGAAAALDSRKSHGLQALVGSFQAGHPLYVLDFGGPVQENIDFITDVVNGVGHRLYVDHLLYSYEYFFSAKEQEEAVFRAGRIEEFIASVLDFPDQSADAILIWDRLQFLPPQVAEAVVARLHRILAPDGFLLALFRTDSSGADRAPYTCRILDGQTLQLREQPPARRVQTFNPRTIQKLFQSYREVKFFVSRESLQEVLIRR
ncbi:MAG: class I SAM-dependent methyltransferase [Bryobacteraceae bacterium]|jgi:SAM-dependent methyltransferase